MYRILSSVLCLSCSLSALAHINGYAAVTGISGAVIAVGATDETAASFTTGKQVIIMQMQDDIIGPNTTNASTFGDISDPKMAGRFVIGIIASVTRTSGVLNSITLTGSVGASFNIGTNSTVQVITYEQLGTTDYTTTADIGALAWNGSIGGVIAFRVNGTLHLRHTISADGKGFRGGVPTTGGGGSCDASTYIAASTSTICAEKGEGIYKLTNTNWTRARGHIANGAGGGNSHNAGGGGGGGYTAGGMGGVGYSCGSTAGGMGGVAMSGQTSASRVFLGGGGGGGEGNNSNASSGATGGGIILVRANAITLDAGFCSTAMITASGSNSADAGANDGVGGGGGGGMVVLNVPTYTIPSGCTLNMRTNGGNGGRVNDGAVHGGGGGGGQGAVILSTPTPSGMIIQTNNGTGGCNSNATPCTSQAPSGAGTNNTGILNSNVGTLPIELLGFNAVVGEGTVHTSWATATEHNNAYFTVERSEDLAQWSAVGILEGAGNSVVRIDYAMLDGAPILGLSYYRLRQTDFDGTTTISQVVPVRLLDGPVQLRVFPNPAEALVQVHVKGVADGRVEVVNALGQRMAAPVRLFDGRAELDLARVPSGTYVVIVSTGHAVVQERLVVRH
ncbi:MAG TPA: T9SS type A sorting domain-containing protein [Flavobacteriales bacterium]